MDVQIWSEVQVDVQTALATAKTLTSISNATTAVVESTAHGYLDGDHLLLRVRGMKQELDYAVARVANVTTDDFELEGINSTDFGAFVSGTAQKITFGASAETITEVGAAGGEAADVLVETIHRKRGFNLPGRETPLVFTMGSLWVVTDPALIEFNKASRTRSLRAVRFTFPDGSGGMFAGFPSASLVPTGSAGAPVTTPLKINVRGGFTPFAAAA